MKKIFTETEDFCAINNACTWLYKNGYSIGSMQSDSPMGILKGDCCIAKWRNLSKTDKKTLDGIIIGEKRNGPVTIIIFDGNDKNTDYE